MTVFQMSGFSCIFVLALTPYQKWTSMRGFGGGELLLNKWFILLMASLVFILSIVFVAVRRFRVEREAEVSEQRFNEYADRYGLNPEERKILSGITENAVVKRKESVFTMMAAFNRGAASLMQQRFSSSRSFAERKKLSAMVRSVRQKLGFAKETFSFDLRGNRRRGLSSRQISVGKKVSMWRPGSEGSATDGVVTGNEELEFSVRPERPVRSIPGEVWRVQYHYGSSTWEFDVLTMACDDESIVLSHSDNIRFVNRRRFLRASVRKRALIASFPVKRDSFGLGLTAPEFVEGTLTELSGPGLRIEADLNVERGSRVLVVFELEPGKVIEDVGEVRGQREGYGRNSIAVELLGLNESGVNELVRATNSAAISRVSGDFGKDEEFALVQENANV